MTLPSILSKVTTHCIGRYLVDIPDVFVLSPGSGGQFYFGLDKGFRTVDFSVPVTKGGQQTLDAIVEGRVKDLVSTYHFRSVSHNKLLEQRRLSDGSQLLRAYDDSRSIATFTSELYSHQGPATLLLSREVYTHENGNSIESSLINIASGSSYIGIESNAVPGACLGPVVINGGQDAEILNPLFQSTQYPDVRIRIDMNSVVAESDGGLFARVNAKADLVSKLVFHSDTLRKDKMTIGGRPAEEILETGKDHDKIMRSFTAETVLSGPSTFAKPLISVDMTMGGQVNDEYRDASLSNSEALVLWDSIVKSIRLRPGAL